LTLHHALLLTFLGKVGCDKRQAPKKDMLSLTTCLFSIKHLVRELSNCKIDFFYILLSCSMLVYGNTLQKYSSICTHSMSMSISCKKPPLPRRLFSQRCEYHL